MPPVRISSGPRSGEVIDLDGELTIGRDPTTNGLVLDDEQVSRQHARISQGPGGSWVLSDLGSSNGTWVTPARGSRRRVTADHTLQPGDQVEIGDTRLVFGTAEPEITIVAGRPAAASAPDTGGGSGRGLLLIAGGIAVAVLAIGAVAGAVSVTSGGDDDCSPREASRQIDPSLALLLASWEGVEGFSAGSGFVVRDDGYIMTNAHVVLNEEGARANEVLVHLSDGREFSAQVREYDEHTDVALIRVDGVSGLTPIDWGRPATLQNQDEVIAAGFPLPDTDILSNLEPSFTEGTVSARRDLDGVQIIQHTAAIEQGNSGGPLVDLCGEVVGVNTLKIRESQALNFAVAASEAERLANQWLPTR